MSAAFEIYKYYRYKFYSKYSHLKGATFLHRQLKTLAQKGIEKFDGKSESIFEKNDWDNLIILDACRYDLYREVNGEVEKRITLGSDSRQFIEETFSEGDFSDVVYVTANPHFSASNFRENIGRDVEETFHEVYHTYETDWSEENGTVMPEAVVRDAKNAKKLFPDKKLIIHFMQPHHPFVNFDIGDDTVESNPWSLAERGKLSEEKVWKMYRDNLEFVMPFAEQLSEELGGTTVITADHGNLCGENGLYHHPYGSDAKGLREVPWDKR
ncbi:MAG: hypothetical protein H8Z69_02660 [Nanohaloarchaea archaeon]|nr:hypothetical protein [Candidatus Nanohaloarchaea archaeon]